MLIQFGNFQFQIATAAYNQLTRKTRAIWARLPILENYEKLQATGNTNDTIQLTGTVYPQHAIMKGGVGGTSALDELRSYVKTLQPRRITTANGKSWGYWILESIIKKDSRWIPDGTPRRQDFQLTLKYFANNNNITKDPDGNQIPRPISNRSLSEIGPQVQAPQLTPIQKIDRQKKAELIIQSNSLQQSNEIISTHTENIELNINDLKETTMNFKIEATTGAEQITEIKTKSADAKQLFSNIEERARNTQNEIQETMTKTQEIKNNVSEIQSDTTQRAKTARESISETIDTITGKIQEVQGQVAEARKATVEQRRKVIQKVNEFRETTQNIREQYTTIINNAVETINGPIREVQNLNKELNQEANKVKRATVNLHNEIETFQYEAKTTLHLPQTLYEQYGFVNAEMLEKTLDLNPGLAADPLLLPTGHKINLPILEPDVENNTEIELW